MDTHKNPEVSAREVLAVKKHETVRIWLKGKEPDTCSRYCRDMIRFGRKASMDPDQFLAWAKVTDPVKVQDLIDRIAEALPKPAATFGMKIALRSFLHTNGYNNLPKAKIHYTLQDWHRGYRKEEVNHLLEYLDDPLQKLYVFLAVESGLRAKTILAIKWKHISEDFEAGTVPVAIRLGPEFYNKKKSAGFTFLGKRSVDVIKQLIANGTIKKEPEALLINRSYPVMFKILQKARDKANLDKRIQINHGFRKYFENCLVGVDPDQKDLLEGHFETVSSKHYTGREWEDLRAVYAKQYPQIDVKAGNVELEQKIQNWQDEKQKLTDRITELEEEKKQTQTILPQVLRDVENLRRELEDLKKKRKK